MAIEKRDLMFLLLFILSFMQMSKSMAVEGCTRTNLETVKDLMGLTGRLFDRQTSLNENILPRKLRQNFAFEDSTQRNRRLTVVNNLLSLISKRESLREMDGDSKTVGVFQVIFESLYNETCKFLKSESGIDCSNVHETRQVLLLLKLREQAKMNLDHLKEMMPRTDFERRYDETYVTWHETVLPNINEDEGISGIFGTFPDYNTTCLACRFVHCLKSHDDQQHLATPST